MNTLRSLSNSEIQIGVLKKLSGTAIGRHDDEHGMVYSDFPPYEILQNHLIPFPLMQEMKRFSRFWDLIYNSGNFKKTVRLLWENDDVFSGFYSFSQWIYAETQSTWKISLNRLSELIFKYLTEVTHKDKTVVADVIVADLLAITGRTVPEFLKDKASIIPVLRTKMVRKINSRQIKHSEN